MGDEYIKRRDVLIKLEIAYDMVRADQKLPISDLQHEVNLIKATDVQPVSHWISVKDRLPEDTEPCAVVTENNGLGVSRLMGRNELEWTLFGEPVLYWMPLPEPPKGGDSE